jgi:short-subunit dehydrogenase
MNWNGKVVVITGASSGIGAEAAFMVARRGGIPVLLARNVSKLEEISRQIPTEHLYLALDVSDAHEAARVFEEIMKRYGHIDVLINNAGFGVFQSFLEMPIEQFSEMMNVNYMGVVHCTKAVLPHMLKRGSGHIVNIASVAGKIATKKTAAYTATKHALIGFSNALRLELRGSGVHISTINPGPIATNFFDRADPAGQYMTNLKKMKGVILAPHDVAEQMLRSVERNRREITLPWFAGIGVILAQLFPQLFEKITASLLDKK